MCGRTDSRETSAMGRASPTRPSVATRAPSVGHHRRMPIEPFSAFEPFGGGVPPESFAGHLLVATPRLADPNFSRSVLLVLDHGGHGALGVVIDRPGGVRVDRVLPQWYDLATPPAELFAGGPVARNALIGLVRLTSRDAAGDDG